MYEVGDKVEIINYGSVAWVSELTWKEYKAGKEYPDNLIAVYDYPQWRVFKYDTRPDLIGLKGFIVKKQITQCIASYAIEDEKEKFSAWYDEGQLKLIEYGIKNRQIRNLP